MPRSKGHVDRSGSEDRLLQAVSLIYQRESSSVVRRSAVDGLRILVSASKG